MDLISRQAVLDLIRNSQPEIYISDYKAPLIDKAYIQTELMLLPTAQPERKKGKWLEITNTNHTYVCSVCGRMLVNITDGKNNVTKNYPFCHCGADMRGDK